MGRGFGLGKVLRPRQPRCTDGASGAEGEGGTGAEANPTLSGSGIDGRRSDEYANRRDAARRTTVTAAIKHLADRSGPRTGKTCAPLLPLCGRCGTARPVVWEDGGSNPAS